MGKRGVRCSAPELRASRPAASALDDLGSSSLRDPRESLNLGTGGSASPSAAGSRVHRASGRTATPAPHHPSSPHRLPSRRRPPPNPTSEYENRPARGSCAGGAMIRLLEDPGSLRGSHAHSRASPAPRHLKIPPRIAPLPAPNTAACGERPHLAPRAPGARLPRRLGGRAARAVGELESRGDAGHSSDPSVPRPCAASDGKQKIAPPMSRGHTRCGGLGQYADPADRGLRYIGTRLPRAGEVSRPRYVCQPPAERHSPRLDKVRPDDFRRSASTGDAEESGLSYCRMQACERPRNGDRRPVLVS